MRRGQDSFKEHSIQIYIYIHIHKHIRMYLCVNLSLSPYLSIYLSIYLFVCHIYIHVPTWMKHVGLARKCIDNAYLDPNSTEKNHPHFPKNVIILTSVGVHVLWRLKYIQGTYFGLLGALKCWVLGPPGSA